MDQTLLLLEDMARNARTGRDAVEHLIKKVKSESMAGELERDRADYEAARRESEEALKNAGGRAEEPGMMARMGMWTGIEAETLTDRSDEHIAEIMIQGATMGIIDMTRSLNTHDSADASARGMASRFVIRQNELIERQKAFLRE